MLIAFDGLDCSGKTTQISLLKGKLVNMGKKLINFKAFKGNALGHTVSMELKHSNIDPHARALLAIGAQIHLANLSIKPILDWGYTFLVDRYFMSTYLYEGVRNKLDAKIDWDYYSSLLPKPDIQIFMYCSPEVFRARLEARNRKPDLVELSLTDNVIHRLIDCMEKLHSPDKNVFTIDTSNLSQEKVHDKIFKEIVLPHV